MAIVTTAVPAAVVVEPPKQTPDDPAPTAEEVEAEPEDIIEDEFALMVLKAVGAIVIVFSIIQLGVGGSAFGALATEKVGGWWIALLSIPAGIAAIAANKRLYVTGTVVLAVLAAILSFVSTIIDGSSATTLHKLVTCSSPYVNYGKLSLSGDSYGCLINFYKPTYLGYSGYGYGYTTGLKASMPCSCVMETGNDCYNYKLTFPTTSVDNCGQLMTSFPRRLDASTVFSTILLILTIALTTVGVIILTCSPGYIGGLATGGKKTEEVPDNTVLPPDNALVGVNGNIDAV